MTKDSSLALKINDLCKTYLNGTQALKGINLSIKEGDFFALLGPNGAGKSTTIGIITTLLPKTSGDVWVYGDNIDQQLESVKSHIGLVPQEFNFAQFEKVSDILYTQAGYYGLSRREVKQNVEKYLKQLGLWDKRNVTARALSGGMKRRLMIARALVHDPKLLILDEPTAGVDIEIRRSMWNFMQSINREGKTIILTTHYLEEAESLCRNIAIIDHGEVIRQGSMRALLQEIRSEGFIFDLESRFNTLLPESLAPYHVKVLNHYQLEATLNHKQSLYRLFQLFAKHAICVKSMRNKSNRLETLFLDLTDHKEKP